MKKNILKLAALGAALVCLLVCAAGVLTACDTPNNDESTKYHVKYYDAVDEFMDQDFLYANKVNAYYRNPNYIEGVTEWLDKYIYAEHAPTSRTFIVTDEEEFAKVFDSFPAEIDFASQMLVVYMFRVINGRNHYLRELTVKDGVLNVTLEEEHISSDVADTTMPGCRCVAIVMDKTEIRSANINVLD